MTNLEQRKLGLLFIVICLDFLSLFAQTTTVNGWVKLYDYPWIPDSNCGGFSAVSCGYSCCNDVLEIIKCADDFVVVNNLAPESVSNMNGEYSKAGVNIGNINVVPDGDDDYDFHNSITGQDVLILQNFLNYPNLYHLCPMSRIAADFDYNGIINSNDLTAMQNHIIGINIVNNEDLWVFIPNIYLKGIDTNDPEFIANFWGTCNECPFNAVYHNPSDNNSSYTYIGTKSWIDRLFWNLTATNGADKSLWSFQTIIRGDLNASFTGDCAPSTAQILAPEVSGQTTSLNANSNYNLLVSVNSGIDSLAGIQMTVQVDTVFFEVNATTAVWSEIQAANNIGATAQLSGAINFAWTSPDGTGVSFDESNTLFKIEVQAKQNMTIAEAAGKITFNSNILGAMLIKEDLTESTNGVIKIFIQ